MVVDPFSDKYMNFSPYVYVANNPLIYVDPDGKEIKFAQNVRSDGTTVITMSVTGKLINESSTTYSKDQMNEFSTRIGAAIKEYYGISGSNLTGKFEVNVSVDLSVETTDNPLSGTDHAFRIKDDGTIPNPAEATGFAPSGVVGFGPDGENMVYLSKDILENKPTDVPMANAGTGLGPNREGTLERTSSHEIGHSGGLYKSNGGRKHPAAGTMQGNLMHQSSKPEAGTKVTIDQIFEMLKNFEDGKLNQGNQKY